MKKIILICIVFSLMLTACQQGKKPVAESRATEKPEESITFTKENYPRVDGSTATIPLSEGSAAKLLNMTKDQAKAFVKHNTTHNAYVNLINGDADIILVTEPSDEELNLAKEKNMELEVVPVVKDAFVFLVNVKNPVDSLTVKQVQDIYQGKITNWSEVGGENKEIIAYQRQKNSGSQTIMENLVMKGLKLADAPKERVPVEMGELIEKVAGFDNSDRAIGYSVYYYAKTMYSRDTIRLIGINGIKPEKDTIMKGSYPFSSAYYAVLKKDETEDSPARRFLKWILSREGQAAAEASGYIPLK